MTENKSEKQSKKLSSGIIIVIVISVLGLLALGASGFVMKKIAGRMVKNAIEQKTGAIVDVDGSGDSVTIKSKDGNMEIGSKTEWPKEIPSDIPRFPSGKITGAVKTEESWSVILSEVEEGDVTSYTSQLKSIGWTVQLESTSVVSIIQLEKDDRQMALAYDTPSKGLSLMITTAD